MSNNIENLPPELQARIAQIIEQGKAGGQQPGAAMAAATAAAAAARPVVPNTRPPSLMDHVIALRQEVAALSQMVQAQGQVTEAVGNAVGQIYQMFHETSTAPTYSSTFQEMPGAAGEDF